MPRIHTPQNAGLQPKAEAERTLLQRRFLRRHIALNQWLMAGASAAATSIAFHGTRVMRFEDAVRYDPATALACLPAADILLVSKYIAHNMRATGADAHPTYSAEGLMAMVLESAQHAAPSAPWANAAAFRMLVAELVLNIFMYAVYCETESTDNQVHLDASWDTPPPDEQPNTKMDAGTALRAGYILHSADGGMLQSWNGEPVPADTKTDTVLTLNPRNGVIEMPRVMQATFKVVR